MPALLHSVALLLALNVQTMMSWAAFAFCFFALAGCLVARQGCSQRRPYKKNMVQYLCLTWLTCIGFNALVLHVYVPAITLAASLATAPALALTISPGRIHGYLKGFGAIIFLYTLGLYPQEIWQVHYTNYNVLGVTGRSWPLLDPNSGAAVINCLLIPAVYIMLGNPRLRWKLLVAVLVVALGITHSKSGMICAGLGTLGVVWLQHGKAIALFIAANGLIAFDAVYAFYPAVGRRLADAFSERSPIWQAGWKMAHLAPWAGTGIGTFGLYYPQYRTENYTAGFFAHNDLLQFAIELGVPVMLLFVALIAAIVKTTRKENAVAAIVMGGVLLQSMVEFQLYVPAISVLMGVALAYHIAAGARTWEK